jgi:hypothetical protein
MWPWEGQRQIQAPTKLKTSHSRDTAGALIGLREAGDKFNCPRYQEAPLWKSGRGPLSGEKVRAQTPDRGRRYDIALVTMSFSLSVAFDIPLYSFYTV